MFVELGWKKCKETIWSTEAAVERTVRIVMLQVDDQRNQGKDNRERPGLDRPVGKPEYDAFDGTIVLVSCALQSLFKRAHL